MTAKKRTKPETIVERLENVVSQPIAIANKASVSDKAGAKSVVDLFD